MTIAHDLSRGGGLAAPARPSRAPRAAATVAAEDVDEREVEYAGFVTRTIAFAIDAAVINVVAIAVAATATLVLSLFPISHKPHDAVVIAGGVIFVVWTIVYFTVFWTATGETPGNRAMRVRVVRADAAALRPRHALVRLIAMLAAVPLLWGYLPILVNDRRRGVHDAVAGTVVLVRSPEA